MYNKIEQKELFFAFLKKKKVYKKYMKNFKESGDNQTWDHVASMLDRNPPSFFFSSAFIWDKTPEGHIYWEKLNEAWFEERKQHGI